MCYEAGRAAACVSECLPHALVTRAGEGVGEGRVEEGGGRRERMSRLRLDTSSSHAVRGRGVET